MPDLRNATLRQPTDADMTWILEHELEIQELRQTQLLRDGRIFDQTMKLVAEMDDASPLPSGWGVTADGVQFSHGSKAYYIDPCGFVHGLDMGLSFRTDTSVPWQLYHPYPIYSSREAAEAARKEVADADV